MEIRRLTPFQRTFSGERRLCWSLLWLSFLLVVGCNDTAPITVIASNPSDRITWAEAEVPTLNVSSPSGIGSARLLTRNGDWPEVFDVTLNLKALEGFNVRSGKQRHTLALTAERRVLLEPAESALQLRRSPSGLVGESITIRITPARFAEPVSELVLEWVDYYR